MTSDRMGISRDHRRIGARFYTEAAWDAVHCHLCPNLCAIAPSRTGNCGVRVNRDGKLYTDNYNRIGHLEKTRASALPLFHLHPSKPWLQVGMKGCDMRCPFCNTYQWSQLGAARTIPMTVEQLVGRALSEQVVGISFGTTEPAVAHEYIADVFAAARRAALKTHLATSGEWSEDPFHELLPVVDAITFGFKGFDSDWLMQNCGGHLELIQANVATALSCEVHVEASYLLIDSVPSWRNELNRYCTWMDGLHRYIPTILLGLTPSFMWKGPATNPRSIAEGLEILKGRIPFAYTVTDGMHSGDTRCTNCGKAFVRRIENETFVETGCEEGQCPVCGTPLPFIV